MLTLWNGYPRRNLNVYSRPLVRAAAPAPRTHTPHTTVREEENGLTLRSEVPGYGPENLDVTFEDGVLTLRGKIVNTIPAEDAGEEAKTEEQTTFLRRFRLPEQVNQDAIQAQVKHGVLTVTLPFAEKPAPRTIAIEVG